MDEKTLKSKINLSQFRTILPPYSFDFSISHQDFILSVGSCFAEHIGKRLAQYKFSSQLNPFGILYNPISIANNLAYLISDQQFDTPDIFFHQNLWHSFNHHGSFSHPDQTLMLQQLNAQLLFARSFLAKANCLIITLGTANTFVHKDRATIVANCHKLPSQHFYRKMLEPLEICEQMGEVFNQLKAKKPNLKILLTVSPVRHIRDGLLESNRSKARLLLACEQLSKQIKDVYYFPAYELIMDDLRDYRFYKEDLVHPSDMAIDYVWQYFATAFFSTPTTELMQQIEQIVKASEHRPFHMESTAHQDFVKRQMAKIDRLEQQQPYLNFEKERSIFEEQIRSSSR